MFGRENCGHPEPRVDQAVQIAPAPGVDTSLVRDQADTAMADQMKAVGQQDVDSRTHLGWRGRGSGSGSRTTRAPHPQSQQDERSVHSKYFAIVVVSLWACGPSSSVIPPQPVQFPPEAGSPALDVDALISTLSVRDKVAQLVMPWIAGTYSSADDPEFVRRKSVV